MWSAWTPSAGHWGFGARAGAVFSSASWSHSVVDQQVAVARVTADMVDHLAVGLVPWVAPNWVICVARADRFNARAAVVLCEHAGELTQPRSVVADSPPQFPATGIYQRHIM